MFPYDRFISLTSLFFVNGPVERNLNLASYFVSFHGKSSTPLSLRDESPDLDSSRTTPNAYLVQECRSTLPRGIVPPSTCRQHPLDMHLEELQLVTFLSKFFIIPTC